ncbi:hypothetical protein [Corynebacterium belfantii]|uniref:hypothetical protein n=1 Tax=Corynebacterium belfantii TaxID=2014537 RepID=UPI0018CB43C9|nr:hypothetical protein [Corynebacterium belfantii]MBG9299793.1 hypothetical protein [Corynebacterium belfantii]MBG9308027.1 hypothetical protein [Corynebacterium belfantii]
MSHVDGVDQAPQDVVVEVDEDVLAALVHGPTQLRDLSNPSVFHTNKRVNEHAHGFVGCLLVGSSSRSVVAARSRRRSQTVFQAAHGACQSAGAWVVNSVVRLR